MKRNSFLSRAISAVTAVALMLISVSVTPFTILVNAADSEGCSITSTSIYIDLDGDSVCETDIDSLGGSSVTNGSLVHVGITFSINNDRFFTGSQVSAGATIPTTYTLDVLSYGITLDVTTDGTLIPSGSSTSVGTWSISNGVLTVVYNEDYLTAHSNISGFINIYGHIDVDTEASDYSGTAKVGVAEKVVNDVVVVSSGADSNIYTEKNVNSVTVDNNGDILIQYTIKASAYNGKVTNVVLKDTWGSDLEFVSGSVTSSQSIAFTQSGNTVTSDSFTLASNETVEYTYTLKLSKGNAAKYLGASYSVFESIKENINNTLSATFINNKNDDVTAEEKSALALNSSVGAPTIDKSGAFNAAGDTIDWTVRIDGNCSDLGDWKLSDTLGDGLGAISNIQYTIYKADGTEYSSGNASSLDDITLTLSSDTISDGKYGYIVVTYSTTASSTSTGVTAPVYTNTATITSTANGGSVSDNASVTGTQSAFDVVKKEAGDQDKTEGTVSWTTTVTVPTGLNVTEFLITDEADNGHEIIMDSINITYNGSDGYNVHRGYWSNPVDFYLLPAEDAGDYSDYFNVKVDNLDLVNNLISEATIVITYKTKYDGLVKDLNNKATVSVKESSGSTATDEVTATKAIDIPETIDVLEKWGTPRTGINAKNYILWEIPLDISTIKSSLSAHGITSSYSDVTLTLTDTIPSGLQYIADSLIVCGRWDNYDSATGLCSAGTSVNGNTLTITISGTELDNLFNQAQKADTVKISFLTGPTDDEYSSYLSGTNSYTNTIKGSISYPSGSINILSVESNSVTPNCDNILTKSMDSYVSGNDYVGFTIEANKAGMNLLENGSLTMEDTLGAGMKFDSSRSNLTVQTYQSGSYADYSNYTLSVVSNSDGTTTITIGNLPDETPIKVTYNAIFTVVSETNFTAENEVKLIGVNSTNGSDSVSKSLTPVYSQGGTTGNYNVIKVYKTSGTDPLSGAVFCLYGFSATDNSWTDTGKTITTGSDGYNLFDNLQSDNLYKIIETQAPVVGSVKYELDTEPYYFLITGNDNKTAVGVLDSAGISYSADRVKTFTQNDITSGSNIITVENEVLTVDVTKTFSDTPTKDEVNTVKFGIYTDYACSTTPIQEIGLTQSGDSYTVSFSTDSLNVGTTYYIKESASPALYSNNNIVAFKIDSTGTVMYADATASNANLDFSSSVCPIFVNSKVTNVTTADLTLEKTTANGTATDLVNAVFGLYSDSACSAQITTQSPVYDNNKYIVTFANVAADNTYYIKEISAPNSYTASTTVFKCVVSDTGTVSYTIEGSASGSDKIDTIPVCNNTKIIVADLTLEKTTDSNGTATDLINAVFGLYSDSACTEAYKKAEASPELSSDKYIVTFSGADLLAGTTYYIKEIGAPNGYTASTTVFQCTVASDGKVSYSIYSSASGSGDSADGDMPVCVNTKTQVVTLTSADIKLEKTTSNGTVEDLTGALFGLYSDEACSAQIATQSPVYDNGKYIVTFSGSGLNLSTSTTYYTKEITAPTGYDVSSTVFRCSVGSDGTVGYSIVGASSGGDTINEIPVCVNTKTQTSNPTDPDDDDSDNDIPTTNTGSTTSGGTSSSGTFPSGTTPSNPMPSQPSTSTDYDDDTVEDVASGAGIEEQPELISVKGGKKSTLLVISAIAAISGLLTLLCTRKLRRR